MLRVGVFVCLTKTIFAFFIFLHQCLHFYISCIYVYFFSVFMSVYVCGIKIEIQMFVLYGGAE